MTRGLALLLLLLIPVAASGNPPVPAPPAPPVVAVPGPIQPSDIGDALRPVISPVVDNLTRLARRAGQDLEREQVTADLDLDARNVDYQIVSLLFGGGKVAADVDAALHLEFRAISTTRLDAALRAASGDANVTLNRTFGVPTHRLALTAEEIRVMGAGYLLQAFQGYEAEAARRYLQETVPGLTVESAAFAWSHTQPASYVMDPKFPDPSQLDPRDPFAAQREAPSIDLREPPLVLDAKVRLTYLDRVSILQVFDAALRNRTGNPAHELKRELQRTEGDAVLDRNAFALAGFSQLLAFTVPPGWRLQTTLQVPRGFTIEGTTQELTASADRRSVSYKLDGDDRTTLAHQAGLVTISNRFLVTITVLALAVLVGYALRLPFEIALLGLPRRHRRATL